VPVVHRSDRLRLPDPPFPDQCSGGATRRCCARGRSTCWGVWQGGRGANKEVSRYCTVVYVLYYMIGVYSTALHCKVLKCTVLHCTGAMLCQGQIHLLGGMVGRKRANKEVSRSVHYCILYTVLYDTLYTVMHCKVLTLLYCIALHWGRAVPGGDPPAGGHGRADARQHGSIQVLYCSILCWSILYCAVRYCTVLLSEQYSTACTGVLLC